MGNRTQFLTIFSLALLVGAGSVAASPCHFAVGPETPLPFAPNPETGFIELTAPMTIGQNAYTVDLQVAIIGFLEVGDDGLPRRALVTHHWRVRENRLQLEWVGEAEAVPTDVPNQVYYRLRLDLVTATGRYGAGVFFVEGIFNLDGTGDVRNLFGKLCFGGDGS
jgi:hypothetical protein